LVQKIGVDPRYVRRLRWIATARAVISVGAPLRGNLGFVLTDPEAANFTYELANEDELAEWVATVMQCELEQVHRLLREAHADGVLAERLREATAGRRWWTKSSPPFGKRLAWYAIARSLKPELIIETGVHDGLGSLVLLRALELNTDEGALGRLVSFDINTASGWIVGVHPLWELRIQPSRTGLSAVLNERPPAGLFIHDSLHTYENERFELQLAASHMAPEGVLITDNAHGTRALADTCKEFGLRYYEFAERSLEHFYPGGAIGAGRRQQGSRGAVG
jgi:predicted O-methyltransferase YrrM